MSFTVKVTVTEPGGLVCFEDEFTTPTAADALIDIENLTNDLASGQRDWPCAEEEE